KKFFRRRGKFVRQPHDDKKSFRKIKEEKKGKEDQRCFKCGDPNHFISDCPKHYFNDQKAFVGGCWSESDEEDESKRDEICLMALDNNEVLSNTPYCNSSSLDNESLQNEYNKLCKISLRIINKNKHLKDKNELLNKEACDLRKRLEQLERNQEVSVKCESCVDLRSKVNSVSLKLASFESSSYFLQEMIKNQRSQEDKHGLGFIEGIASTSNTKMKKLCHVDEKTSIVEPALPVPSKIQVQKGCPIVSIRMNHGREFDNEVQFGAFCDANGITHNFLTSHTPQSNGVVERKNRTLQEMSQAMLNEHPQKFWCDAVDTSTYILNRILIRPFLRKTPYELFKGKKSSLDYFKVFGSECFILNTKDYLTKFDPKSTEGVFLGYSPNTKPYIILNKETMRIEESLNIRFDERPPPKSSPLVDDDIIESQIIENQIEDKENGPLNKEIMNIKESKDHLIEKFIGILNERTLRSKNKARLVAQGYNQQEGIDFDETYAPVARLESIRILLAYACAHDFKPFQMDVKSSFLKGFINKEVYVAQPPAFVDFKKPNHVFKLKKALYGLKQAPKAWYDRLKAFLLDHKYTMGLVDNTLFTKKRDSHIIIVQIYVDDIIFRSTCQDLCDDFSKIMHDEFEMSMMGELNFFLDLQIKQLEDDIFFNQSKYIKEMLKKFGLEDYKPIKTPMSSETKLTQDEDKEFVDDTKYCGMIGSLL
ncbi:retrovirus-related pol polyprotein from transposon TNT 1-94, partial [Tanacetum coccineum]